MFMNKKFIKENHIAVDKLAQPIQLFNIDGTENRDGTITHVAILDMITGTH